MGTSESPEHVLDEARRHHLAKVNDVLRRPGMYGPGEMAERLPLEGMAAVDGSLQRWWTECDALRDRDAFTATGVKGAYSNVLPASALRDATASIYAEIAYRFGWLTLDRALTGAEFQQLRATVSGWAGRDRDLPQLIGTFGGPSLWIGGANPNHPKTLAYTTADHDDDLVCFHLWNTIPEGGPGGLHPEPVVLAVRHRPGSFPDSFCFTPQGLRQRPTTDQQSPLRSTVWIFHGEHARSAAAAFETQEAGLAWRLDNA